ncbi:hypothetical protein E2562_013679 [Oryza meyeriana var. granulata]|uniref:F-box domain-containing protein n=1 Tax=Oryza meyeriana var. granulata TaxID=110450 RepID=A0A6G1BKE7_9ORYZ|nr:hypothetical protein E2562_013679 [Oryza meyeriana var. granulata]
MRTSAVAAVDLISELNDDVLLLILRFLPSATDVARTSVLSKRWRHLWSIAPCLRFAVGQSTCDISDDDEDEDEVERKEHGRHVAARRLISGVDASLARRAAGERNDVEVLEISFVYSSPYDRLNKSEFWGWYFDAHRHVADITSSHVAAWLRFAERHVKGSFTLEVPADYDVEGRVLLAELPCSARAETMRLTLGCATLTVPAARTDAFCALTDFHLSHVKLAAAGDDELCHRLGLLLSSSCCPQLRRLSLKHIVGLTALRLEAAVTLEELRLVYLPDLLQLDVDAPGLRLLRVDHCELQGSVARISAPRLEVLACDDLMHPSRLLFDGVVAVRHIKKLVLYSFHHGQDDPTAIWVLKNCTAVDHLELELMIGFIPEYKDIIKEVPNLPTVTNLKMTVCEEMGWHTIGSSLARLIAKCNRIEHLSINIKSEQDTYDYCSYPFCICRQPKGWEDQMISLEHLRMVDICGFRPFDDQIGLVQLLLTGSPALDTMIVELDGDYLLKSQKESKLIDFYIPCYEGIWVPCAWGHDYEDELIATKYKWTRKKQNRGIKINLVWLTAVSFFYGYREGTGGTLVDNRGLGDSSGSVMLMDDTHIVFGGRSNIRSTEAAVDDANDKVIHAHVDACDDANDKVIHAHVDACESSIVTRREEAMVELYKSSMS